MKKEYEVTPRKPARRMSSCIQSMARIERIMAEVEVNDRPAVLAWFAQTYLRPADPAA